MATTRKGVWGLQEVRDQYLDGVWELNDQLWAWGSGANGRLGINATTDRSSPVQIPGTTWSSISGGNQHSLAIQSLVQ